MSVTPEVKTDEAGQAKAPPRRRRRRTYDELHPGERRLGIALVLPTIILLAIVIGYPVVRAIVMSFQKDPGLDTATGMFVSGGNAGFSNYTHWLLQQCTSSTGGTTQCPPGTLGGQFWDAMFVTVFFTVCTVVIEVALGMWMAIVMNRAFAGRALLRASVLVPWAIPTAVTAKLWFFIFAFDGIANRLFGIHVLWTGDAWASRFAVIFADGWQTTPFIALLILAGLQVIR